MWEPSQLLPSLTWKEVSAAHTAMHFSSPLGNLKKVNIPHAIVSATQKFPVEVLGQALMRTTDSKLPLILSKNGICLLLYSFWLCFVESGGLI
jgi:hypothetical protein